MRTLPPRASPSLRARSEPLARVPQPLQRSVSSQYMKNPSSNPPISSRRSVERGRGARDPSGVPGAAYSRGPERPRPSRWPAGPAVEEQRLRVRGPSRGKRRCEKSSEPSSWRIRGATAPMRSSRSAAGRASPGRAVGRASDSETGRRGRARLAPTLQPCANPPFRSSGAASTSKVRIASRLPSATRCRRQRPGPRRASASGSTHARRCSRLL